MAEHYCFESSLSKCKSHEKQRNELLIILITPVFMKFQISSYILNPSISRKFCNSYVRIIVNVVFNSSLIHKKTLFIDINKKYIFKYKK